MPKGIYDRSKATRQPHYGNRLSDLPTLSHKDKENQLLHKGDSVYTLGYAEGAAHHGRASSLRKGKVLGFIGKKSILIDFGDYTQRKRVDLVLRYMVD